MQTRPNAHPRSSLLVWYALQFSHFQKLLHNYSSSSWNCRKTNVYEHRGTLTADVGGYGDFVPAGRTPSSQLVGPRRPSSHGPRTSPAPLAFRNYRIPARARGRHQLFCPSATTSFQPGPGDVKPTVMQQFITVFTDDFEFVQLMSPISAVQNLARTFVNFNVHANCNFMYILNL